MNQETQTPYKQAVVKLNELKEFCKGNGLNLLGIVSGPEDVAGAVFGHEDDLAAALITAFTGDESIRRLLSNLERTAQKLLSDAEYADD